MRYLSKPDTASFRESSRVVSLSIDVGVAKRYTHRSSGRYIEQPHHAQTIGCMLQMVSSDWPTFILFILFSSSHKAESPVLERFNF